MSKQRLTRRRFLAGAAGLAGGTTRPRGRRGGVGRRRAGSARRAAGRAAGQQHAGRRRSRPTARKRDLAPLRPAALLRRAAGADRDRRPHAGGGAADTRADLSMGAERAPLHGRLGAALLRARPRRADPDAEAEGAVRLRASDLRRLRPLPPPRLRQRATARRRRARARPRPPLPGSRRRSTSSGILRWRETRTGFVGPDSRPPTSTSTASPPGSPVPTTSPLFMGFKSGFKKNQASEDDVTIPAGPFADGTTMQVSYMRLRLDSWYGILGDEERVARMYAPEVTPAEVERLHRRRAEPTRTIHAGRRAATASSATRRPPPVPATRGTADHPPRLRHRRRRPRRPPLRLDPAMDRRLRHHPKRDERRQRLLPQPRDHRHHRTTASTSSSSSSNAPTTSSPRARPRSFPLYPGQAAALSGR